MSYESKLFVALKSTLPPLNDGDKLFAMTMATFELGKVTEFSNWAREQKETNYFIYADDGNTQIVEDKYGKPLTELNFDDVIKKLEECNDNDCYWRYNAVRGALISLYKCYPYSKEDLLILHYGH